MVYENKQEEKSAFINSVIRFVDNPQDNPLDLDEFFHDGADKNWLIDTIFSKEIIPSISISRNGRLTEVSFFRYLLENADENVALIGSLLNNLIVHSPHIESIPLARYCREFITKSPDPQTFQGHFTALFNDIVAKPADTLTPLDTDILNASYFLVRTLYEYNLRTKLAIAQELQNEGQQVLGPPSEAETHDQLNTDVAAREIYGDHYDMVTAAYASYKAGSYRPLNVVPNAQAQGEMAAPADVHVDLG